MLGLQPDFEMGTSAVVPGFYLQCHGPMCPRDVTLVANYQRGRGVSTKGRPIDLTLFLTYASVQKDD